MIKCSANGIFANTGILTNEFETEVGKYMFNDVENVRTVDFQNYPEQATRTINNWIKQQTNGMIDPMYQETLDSQLALIMVSSLYFKSSWNNKFSLITKKSSEEEKYAACWPKSFENTKDCDERVQFMMSEGDFPVVTVTDNGQPIMEVIEIPLEGNERTFTYNGQNYGNKMQFQIWLPKGEDIRDPVVDKKVKLLTLFSKIIRKSLFSIKKRSKTFPQNIVARKITVLEKSNLQCQNFRLILAKT